MKKIIYIPSMIVLICCFSCHKVLDQTPISAATVETFYTTAYDFTQATNAIYANLRPYPDRLLNLSETRSDNLYAVSEGGVRQWDPVNAFHTPLANNPYVGEAWLTNFNGIQKANV